MNRGSALRRQGGGGWSPGEGEPHPFLATAALYIDAALHSDGRNQGTAGSALDATVAYMDGTEKAAVYGGVDTHASTTLDAAGLDLTGDFCIAIDVHPLWAPPIPCEFVAKPLGVDTADCYAFGIGVDGIPFVEVTRDGQTVHEAYGFTSGDGADVDVDYSADTDRKQLIVEFDADDGASHAKAMLYEGVPGASPTLISTITIAGAVTMETSAELLKVGTPMYGAVYRVRLYSGRLSSPTLVAEFYPDRDHTSGSTMTAGGSTSEQWSNVGTVETEGFAAAVVPSDAALDIAADGDATVAFWMTTPFLADVDGEQYPYCGRVAGNLFGGGEGFQVSDVKIDGFGIDGAGCIVAQGGAPVPAISNTGWAAGARLVVVTVDRTADLLTVYRDGVEHATGDISTIGALDPAADLLLLSAAHHAVAKWDEVLDPATIAAVR